MTRKLFLSLGLAPLLLAGCGGSGSSSNSVTAQHAALDVAKAAHSYRHLIGLARLQSTVQSSEPTGEKIYDDMLDVDYRVTLNDDGSYRVRLSEPDGDQSLGEIRILTVDGEPYPVTTRLTVNATIHGSFLGGGYDYVAVDEEGMTSKVVGQYNVTNPRGTVYFDLSSTNGVSSGTFGARVEDNDVVDFRDITDTETRATHANFTTRGRTGTVTIETDGSGEAVSTDGSGTYTIRWTTDWNVTLVRPDGSSTVLGSIDEL